MPIHGTLFGDASNYSDRFVPDYSTLGKHIEALRHLGLRIVLTSGSFDLIHIGHALYLEEAKAQGNVLVVGVDSDERIRERKGSDRPIVPQDERLQMLTHLRYVDLVTLKPPGGERWALIDAIRPDVLVVTKATYSEDEIRLLESTYKLKVYVLDRMAPTATTERVRQMQFSLAERLQSAFSQELPGFVNQIIERMVPRGN